MVSDHQFNIAPELARGGEHGTKSDIWSLGIVDLEMTSRLLSYTASELRQMSEGSRQAGQNG